MHPSSGSPTHNHSPNHLAGQSSPYLKEHLYNPVDWYPYGAEAFEKAVQEDKPIFLSLGYSACHWCHVMARESFENEAIAAYLNAHFVSIKVDREERPDLDNFYQTSVQLMGRSGGWPLSIFMTPNRKIFFGGTYFPPTAKYGMLGFPEILQKLIQLYRTHRADLESSGDEIHEVLGKIFTTGMIQEKTQGSIPKDIKQIDNKAMQQIVEQFLKSMDSVNGGFGGAPKFPMFPALVFLLRQYQETQIQIPGDIHRATLEPDQKARLLELVEKALDGMGNGGIYDHIGGGFARYAVDDHWAVPHFEKMLYDNAMALVAYSEAYQLFRKPRYKAIVQGIIEWAYREMWDPKQGFHSTLNADSEGEEGKYYVWTQEELEKYIPSADHLLFFTTYNITPGGNFEDGKIILNRLHSDEELAELFHSTPDLIRSRLQFLHDQLLKIRTQRIHPEKDDKSITGWNALMVHGLAAAYPLFDQDEFGKKILQLMVLTNQLIRERLFHAQERRLYRIYHEGHVKISGMLEDYAYFIQALWDEFEITHKMDIIPLIKELIQITQERFGDSQHPDFYFAEKTEDLPISPKIGGDMPLPNPSAILAETFLQSYYYLGDATMHHLAEQYLSHELPNALNHPMDHATFWLTVQWFFYGPVDLGFFLSSATVESFHREAWRQALAQLYIPRLHQFIGQTAEPQLVAFAGKSSPPDGIIFSLCLHFNCLPFFNTPEAVHNFLTHHQPAHIQVGNNAHSEKEE